ncbi:MAG: hypothetical protein ABSE73_14210 [Planctomycetota bacterium]
MNILALDTGTTTGWALLSNDGRVQFGSWHLADGASGRTGTRFLSLFNHLPEIQRQAPLQFVFYEEVHGHSGMAAAHVYGGLVGVLTLFCELNGVSYRGVTVQAIKKHATGGGTASKEAMVAAAAKKFCVHVEDDNQADALFLLDYAIQSLGNVPAQGQHD